MRRSKKYHTEFLYICISILPSSFFACDSSKAALATTRVELDNLKQQNHLLVKEQKEEQNKLELEIANSNRWETQWKQCQTQLAAPTHTHHRAHQECAKQNCVCANPLIPISISPLNTPSSVLAIGKDTLDEMNQVDAEVEHNQQGIEAVRQKLDAITKMLDEADKAKSKQQRIVTKQEHELFKLAPSSSQYAKSQKRYEIASQTLREFCDRHTSAVRQYGELRKAERDSWKDYLISVQRLRSLLKHIQKVMTSKMEVDK